MGLVTKNGGQLLSKIATNNGHGEESPYFDGWKAYESDPYHPDQNPNGVIQMGLAENQLCFDLIQDWVVNHPKASICTAEGANDFKDIAIYQDYHGLPEFRNAIAKFMGRVRGNRVTFDPNRIVMSGGATGAHEMLAFCLADPADAFLVPTPYYPGFDRDLRWRTGVELVPVASDSSNNFKITKAALEGAMERAKESKIKVKGLLITNPSNPLGTILDTETLRTITSFISQQNIHLICDEIYAATVFNKPDFTSIAEIIEEEETKCSINRGLIHIVDSLSKNMGFPGFRSGIVYSYNDSVVSCARKMSSFGLVSTQTQKLVSSMISDEKFVESFLAASAERLAKRHETLTKGLGEVSIGSLKSNAGLFIWMDLRWLLKEPTFEAEMDLWDAIIHEAKLNISPGSSFHCSDPGWFRVCFANVDDETMRVALQRVQRFVFGRRCWRSNLRVELPFRVSDDFVKTVSPRSPTQDIDHSKFRIKCWCFKNRRCLHLSKNKK